MSPRADRTARAEQSVRAIRAGPSGDRGSASLELAIITPGLLLILAVLLQAGWWYMARSAAHAAAAEGTRAARTHGAPADAGPPAATRFAHQVSGGQLRSPTADAAGSDTTTVVITVRGRAPSFVPGWSPTVSQTVRAPRERFTSETRGTAAPGATGAGGPG